MRNDRLPSWLDVTVPDDRFVAPSLLLQAEYPGSAVYVATGDLNLQTKLAAAGLPFIELVRRLLIVDRRSTVERPYMASSAGTMDPDG